MRRRDIADRGRLSCAVTRVGVINTAGWLGLAAGWLLAATGRADSSVHLRTTRAAEYLVSHWTSEQGLPQNTVTCLLQTRDGYLWLGTRYGLVRFDGVRFTAYGEELGGLDLRCLDVQGLAEDAERTLWVRTAAGVVTLRKGQFQPVALDDLPLTGPVVDLRESQRGGVWVARTDGLLRLVGLQVADRLTLREDIPTGAPTSNWLVERVHEDIQGRLWLATTDGTDVSWLRLDPATRRVETLVDLVGPESRGAWSVREDGTGGLWVAQTNALLRWKPGTGTLQRFDASKAWGTRRVAEMVEDQRGNLWAVSHWTSQLYRFGQDGFRNFDPEDGLSVRDDFRCLLTDREGNVWVGTGGGGINRLQPRQLVAMWGGNRSTLDEVYSVSPGPDGTTWLATSYGLVRVRDGESQVVPNTLDQPDAGWVLKTRPVLAGRGGEVWMGVDGVGLATLAGDQFEPVTTPNLRTPIDKRLINSLLETGAGDLWVGTPAGLLQAQAGRYRLWTTNDGLSDNRVFGLVEAADGSVWVGTERGGINRVRDGRFHAFTIQQGLLSQRAWPLHAEPDGTLWVGTPAGLNRIRGSEVRKVTTRDGLFDPLAYCLLDDRRGHYWTFGNRGIWRVRKADLHAVADGTTPGLVCISYGEADGMLSVEGNGDQQPNAALMPNGELWFPTTRGVVMVDPEHLRDNTVAPGVVIEEVRADDEVVFRDGGKVGAPVQRREAEPARSEVLRLGPGRARVLAVRFTATTFVDSAKARFRYRLTGHDVGWRDGGTERVAFYTNLRPGAYDFEVSACNHHGYWSRTPAVFSFRLAPRFYQTWTFRLSCLAAVAAGLAGWHFRRLESLQEEQWQHQQRLLQEERGRIAKDLHDDLGASMTGIALQMEVARQRVDCSALPDQLQGLAAALRSTVGRMRELVWMINPECDTLESVCAYLGQYAEEFLGAAGLRCRLDLPLEVPPCSVSADARHQLLMVVKEALNNVAKHARATEVHLHLQWDRRGLILTIADNGQGLPPAHHPQSAAAGAATELLPENRPVPARSGQGLTNMRRRVENLGGTLSLGSEPGQGTRLHLRIPLGPRRGR